METIGHVAHGCDIITPPKQNPAIRGPSEDDPIALDNSNIQIQNIKRISPILIIRCEYLGQLLVDHKSCLLYHPDLYLAPQSTAYEDLAREMLE
jgi:hypothetical protein